MQDCLNHELWLSFGGEGGKGRGKVKAKKLTVRRLLERLSQPSVDNSITYAEYMALTVDEKGARKAAPGFLIAGKFRDGRRKATHLVGRSAIQIDIDNATPAQVEFILDGSAEINEFCYLWHTTRAHSHLKPRIRLLFPLDRMVDADTTNALTRLLATKLALDEHESIEIPDLVSFRPNQIMYLPSVSKGQAFRHGINKAPILDVDAFLAAHPGWDDIAQLPRQEAEKSAAASNGKTKAENPLEKKGIIGDFCRAYRVEEAIETFIPDVYVPGDDLTETRYTYAYGTGANGAVVYDDGLFLHSHHGSDPASGLHNAWDLVRVHLFGEQDDSAPEGTTPGNMPSFKAMVALAEKDPRVQAERLSAYDFDDDEFEDIDGDEDEEEGQGEPEDDIAALLDMAPEKPAEKKAKDKPEAEDNWRKKLELDKDGNVKPSRSNCDLIVANDPRVKGLALNDLTGGPVLRKVMKFPELTCRPVTDKITGRGWIDADTAILSIGFARPPERKGYGCAFTDGDLEKAMLAAAERNIFNPVLDMIHMTIWDGLERVETVLIRHLGAPDTPYVRELTISFFVAAIARLHEPGHPYHLVPILGGKQGGGKTGFLKAIAFGGKFYGELSSEFGDIQKMVESTRGCWIMEMPELSGMRRKEVTDVKQYFTAEHDTVRLAYRRNEETFPRRFVCMGTTNETEFLRDVENRRFCPVPVSVDRWNPVDWKALEAEVGQLWAEAEQMYFARRRAQPKGQLHLGFVSREAMEEAVRQQEKAREQTMEEILAEAVEEWLDTPVSAAAIATGDEIVDQFDGAPGDRMFVRNLVSAGMIQEHLAGKPGLRGGLTSAKVVGLVMKNLGGWTELGKCRRAGKQARWYARVPHLQDEFIPVDTLPGWGVDPEIEALLS